MPSDPLTLKVVQIGNSRGVRLPKGLLARHRIGDSVSVRSTESGILLAPNRDKRLGWTETYKAMAAAKDDKFSDMDVAVADGLEDEQ